jgi:hypothetical protein
MSVTTSQIFVRTVHLDALTKAIESYLAGWSKKVRASWPDVPYLGTDSARTTRILPPLDGWCAVVDPDPYHVDFQLASALSSALSTRVVALALRGGELTWTHAVFEGGAALLEEREPPEAFVDGREEGAMPMYVDVTREALREMQSEGVPREYWCVRFDDFVEGASTDAQDGFWVDEIVTRPQQKSPVNPATRTLFVVKRYNGSVSFRPDVEGLDEKHRSRFVEIRTLFGTAEPHVVDGLLEIERADTNRLLGRFLGRSGADVPDVHFEYSGPGVDETALSDMLRRRRADFFRSRPTAQQFLGIALGVVANEHPEWEEVHPDGFGLKLRRKKSDRALDIHIDLAAPYADFMAGRLIAATPEEAASSYLKKAAENYESASEESDFEAHADRIIPALVGPEEGARLSQSGVVARPLGHGVMIVLAARVGEGSALLEEEDLQRWGVKYKDVLKAARDNLGSMTDQQEHRFIDIEIVPGKAVLADLSGNDPATRILLPDLSSMIKRLTGSDEALCAIPDLDSFFVAKDTSDETRAELRAFARERMMAAENPLTAELFIVRPDSVEEA